MSAIVRSTVTENCKISRSFLSCGYFLKYSHLAISAKLIKGDRINESTVVLQTALVHF